MYPAQRDLETPVELRQVCAFRRRLLKLKLLRWLRLLSPHCLLCEEVQPFLIICGFSVTHTLHSMHLIRAADLIRLDVFPPSLPPSHLLSLSFCVIMKIDVGHRKIFALDTQKGFFFFFFSDTPTTEILPPSPFPSISALI